ncbi:type II secretion system minor pseudopilin GspJ [Candidatus Halobeggiatoa sp. HSG11]|nr:type II secretion system minor pseudopilin GspJ [Candidatus Halobeggiatoa sp. HSG11]
MFKSSVGFTLLELLVALAVFAVIAAMAYSGLNTILTARLHIEQQAAQLAELQKIFINLGRDIEQHVQRPIRNQYGDEEPHISGTINQIEFTRSGWRNPAQQNRSSLQRVAYHLQADTLIRSYWFVLDRAQDSEPRLIELSNNINDMRWYYLDNKLTWHERWPTTNSAQLKAIKVILNMEGWGNIERLFRVPQ